MELLFLKVLGQADVFRDADGNRDVTTRRARWRRGELKTGRDFRGARACDFSDDITDDSDIVFIVENA
jgi:hypothetical protein